MPRPPCCAPEKSGSDCQTIPLQIASAENPMFGAEGEEGGNVNPLWTAGVAAAGDESPLAPGAVKTREVRAVHAVVGEHAVRC